MVLPEGLKTIGTKAFADCVSLQEAVFPASLTQVEPLAFSRTALTSPVLPQNASEKSSPVWYASEDHTDPDGRWIWNLLADGSVSAESVIDANGAPVEFAGTDTLPEEAVRA